MDNSRRRMAIATFASLGDVERTAKRLQALGVAQCERFFLPADQKPSDLAHNGPGWPSDWPSGARGDRANVMLLRVVFETAAQEQVVTKALLESDAQSVQLHDIDPLAGP
jgi:hypothetical protein